MVGSSWSSSSSCTSSLGLGSLDEDVVCVVKPHDAMSSSSFPERCVKFLCSYGGRILPRRTDGALRYVGGDNRVLSVDRSSLHFYELQRKLCEMCGWDVGLRCQLPTEDLDALVSVTNDDDLVNLLEEYDAANKDRTEPLKIRAFVFPRTPAAVVPLLPPTSPPSRTSTSNNVHYLHRQKSSPAAAARVPPTLASPWWAASRGSRSAHWYLVHNGSLWQ